MSGDNSASVTKLPLLIDRNNVVGALIATG